MKANALRIDHTNETTDWHAALRVELDEVEHRLTEMVGSDIAMIHDLSCHLLEAGGKRLRPALVILASQASPGSASADRVSRLGAAVELIHMASLVHDDVVDNSEFRRGRVTANAFWGNKVSVLSGDCMLARAFYLLAEDADKRVLRVIAQMTVNMSESEALQALCDRNMDAWRKNYWQIIRHKTAGFLSACCRCGAILANAPLDVQESLAHYGLDLGMAFQLTDDILDIIGQPNITGKPVGNDLREGKVTLPMLLALKDMSNEEREWARSIVENMDPSAADVEALYARIAETEAVEIVRKHARTFAERAKTTLGQLPPSHARDSLSTLASDVVYRIE